MRVMICIFLCTLAGCAAHPKPAPTTVPITSDDPAASVYPRPIDQAISQGIQFLERSQNPDGSWGTGTVSVGNEIDVSVPGSHDAFRVATTSLCVMALREAGEKPAHDRGVEYLLSHFDVRRADESLIYNIWAHLYIVQALAGEAKTNHDPRIAKVVSFHLDRMARYETYIGGWNYYDFDAGSERPSEGPTSFGTAAGLIGLYEAKQAGFDVSMEMVARGEHRLEEMRLPNGACLYGSDYKYIPLLRANTPKGSAGRAVTVDDALFTWGDSKVDESAARAGLDQFFALHTPLEMGRKMNYPHESWYQVSGYYYYFDHYYAARLIEKLGPEGKRDYAQKLIDVILPHQEADGSWWDYAMWDYHKPYGTAFAVMTLLRCK